MQKTCLSRSTKFLFQLHAVHNSSSSNENKRIVLAKRFQNHRCLVAQTHVSLILSIPNHVSCRQEKSPNEPKGVIHIGPCRRYLRHRDLRTPRVGMRGSEVPEYRLEGRGVVGPHVEDVCALDYGTKAFCAS